MRRYKVTVTIRPKGKESYRFARFWISETYEVEYQFNIRAVTVACFRHFFGCDPVWWWAASGDLGMGGARDSKHTTRTHRTIEVFQVTRMTEAYDASREVIWRATQPRLTERRAA